MTTASVPNDSTPAGPLRWRWLIVAVMLAADIMDLFDGSIVNVAGPSLEESLGSTSVGLQWVIGGYALTLGAGLILGGRLGDRFGRRRMFLIGISTFTIASLLCALAPTIGILIVLRLIQGLAAAALLPQGLGLVRENFSGPELVKVFGVFGPVFGLGGIIGPVLGGALIQWNLFDLGWRLVFLVNIPIGIAALIIAFRILPRKKGTRTITVDVVGALIVAVSSALIVLPLNQGQADGWPAWTWFSFAAGAGGFALFVLQQRRIANRGKTPLVTPSLFKKPAYTVGLAGIALFFSGLVGTQLVLTLFLQIGNGFTAGQAGLGNLPLAIGTAIGGAVSGAVLADKLGRGVLQIGAVVQIAGALLLWFELGQTGEFTIWQILPGILVAGVGSGLNIAALFTIILGAVENREIGSASGVLNASQSIASSIGVAVFGSVFFNALKTGPASDGFRGALIVQIGLLVVFFAITFLFPKEGKHEEAGETGADQSEWVAEPSAGVSGPTSLSATPVAQPSIQPATGVEA